MRFVYGEQAPCPSPSPSSISRSKNRRRRSPRANRTNRSPDFGKRNQIPPKTTDLAAADSAKKSSKATDAAPSTSSAKSKSAAVKTKKTKAKDSPVAGDNSDKKKVLLEDTPSLDTYESRRRARLLMGGLSATCVLLLGWITYRTFLYDPSPIDIPTGDATTAQQGGPEPKPSKDGEARFMFNRAKELADEQTTRSGHRHVEYDRQGIQGNANSE